MIVYRSLAVISLVVAAAMPAFGQGVVEKVHFESKADSLDFTFTASTPIDGSLAEVIPARGGEVLILRLGGITAERRWVEVGDRAIKRVLLHPSTQRPPGAILRIRFKKKVITRDLIKHISADYVGDDRRTVLISVPRPSKKKRPKTGKRPSPEPRDVPDPTPAPSDRPPDPAEQPAGTSPPASPPPPSTPAATPPAGAPATAEPASSPAEMAMKESPSTQTIQAVILPSDPMTADIQMGLDSLTKRLRTGLQQRPGIARVAMLPFTAMDAPTRRGRVDGAVTALLGARLTHQGGWVQVDPEQVVAALGRLHRGEDGRYALDEARAIGRMLGADTLISGNVSETAEGVTVRGRAIDIGTGRDLARSLQVLDPAAMAALTDAMIDERTAAGAIWRSALAPGWGQLHQGHTGRGAGYLTAFTVTLGAGLISAALGSSAEADYNSNDPSTVSRRADADDHYARATALLVGAGAVWMASLIDAIATSEDQLHWDVDFVPPPPAMWDVTTDVPPPR